MLKIILNFISSLIMSIYGFYMIKTMTKSIKSIKNQEIIILLLILTILGMISHTEDYVFATTIVISIINLLIYKKIFEIKTNEAIILVGSLMVITFMGDLLASLLFSRFFTVDQIRNNSYIYFIANLFVCIMGTLIIRIKAIQQIIEYLYKKAGKLDKLSTISYILFLIIALSLITSNMANSFHNKNVFLGNTMIFISYLIIVYYFVEDKKNYDDLRRQYNELFDFLKEIEERMEQEELTNHEYKNQLASILYLTKEKKVKAKINDIINNKLGINSENKRKLYLLPKGGLRGLIYYKTSQAEKEKIEIVLDIMSMNENLINDLSENQKKELYYLIGIYFDNAIEATKECKKKYILVEIYEIRDTINIIISNTFKRHKNFNKRYEKGITTKGKGHGKGLFFAKKIINRNDWITEEQSTIDNYYYQKLIIKKHQ